MDFNFINDSLGSNSLRRKSAITAKNFFEYDNNVGYFNKGVFGGMMEQIKVKRPSLFIQYANAITAMKNNMQIIGALDVKTHQINKSDYLYLRFRKGNQAINSTIYLVERMEKFILDYAEGKIIVDFTLAELIEEAEND